jgi:hypothetical protein
MKQQQREAQARSAGNSFIRSLDDEFARLHERSCALLLLIPAEHLYRQPRVDQSGKVSVTQPVYSCGEYLLRSAAAVEQTFGGITVNLWDDPFEWTLPETLSTPAHVREYFVEVETTRRRGFSLIASDDELRKEIMLPSGERSTLFALILETLQRASNYQGRAFASFRLFSDSRLPAV